MKTEPYQSLSPQNNRAVGTESKIQVLKMKKDQYLKYQYRYLKQFPRLLYSVFHETNIFGESSPLFRIRMALVFSTATLEKRHVKQ